MQLEELTTRGLNLACDVREDYLVDTDIDNDSEYYLMVLNFRYRDRKSTRIALRLSKRRNIKGFANLGLDEVHNTEETP